MLLGTGGYRPRLEAMARELGVAGRVSFLGSRPDVPAVLRRARVAVLASHGEGLPNGVLEAMAAGLPVVATDVGGTAELVEDTVTGWMVPPRDVEALGGAIARLVDEPAAAARMGVAGRGRVEERFTAARMAAEVEEVYSRVLARSS